MINRRQRYGSIIASQMLRSEDIKPRIGPIVFIDPVAFLLHLPDVAYNFVRLPRKAPTSFLIWTDHTKSQIHRKPTRANEYQLSYFASKDISIAYTLFRCFNWAESILWKEDIKNHQVAVTLAGKDLITNTKAVAAYLRGVKDWTLEPTSWDDGVWQDDWLRVEWFPELDHAQIFDKRHMRDRLVEIVRQYCKEV